MTWWNANSELEANIAELQGDLEDSKDALRKNDYTIKALKELKRPEEEAIRRGKPLEEIVSRRVLEEMRNAVPV